MKYVNILMGSMVALSLVTAGCAGIGITGTPSSAPAHQETFQELTVATQYVPGKALLRVEFPVKTFRSRLFNTYYQHTDPPYTAELTIDEQTIILTDEPELEAISGALKDNPETGTGWKYIFKKNLVLQPGKHRITIIIPLADVAITTEIELGEGDNTLQFVPEYNAPIVRSPKYPHFSRGVKRVVVKLNNREL